MTLILALHREDERPPDEPGAAKALVMAEIAGLVERGDAVVATLESGAIELRFATGEVFHLGAAAVTRIA